jgi:hypothetical protein
MAVPFLAEASPDMPDRGADARLDSVRRLVLAEGSLVEAAVYTHELLVFRVESSRFDDLKGAGPRPCGGLRRHSRSSALRRDDRGAGGQGGQGLPGPRVGGGGSSRALRGLRPEGARHNLIADLQAMADRLARGAAAESDELPVEIAEQRRRQGSRPP